MSHVVREGPVEFLIEAGWVKDEWRRHWAVLKPGDLSLFPPVDASDGSGAENTDGFFSSLVTTGNAMLASASSASSSGSRRSSPKTRSSRSSPSSKQNGSSPRRSRSRRGRDENDGEPEPQRVIMVMNISAVARSQTRRNTVKIYCKEVVKLRFPDSSECDRWFHALERLVRNAEAAGTSFFRTRPRISVQFYLCGEHYFSDLLVALRGARRSVLISAWAITPELILDRSEFPPDPRTRIDLVLQERARAGVRINVLMYDEPPVGLNLHSSAAKRHLESLHRNVSVIAYRPHVASVYSHHMKLVVVDGCDAFVGGIDIARGRFDTDRHPLSDVHGKTWPGGDYYNPYPSTSTHRTRHHACAVRAVAAGEALTARSFHVDALDRRVYPRLPWHDVQARVSGAAAADAAMTFAQIWNHRVEAAGSGDGSAPQGSSKGGNAELDDDEYSDEGGVGFGKCRYLHPGGRWTSHRGRDTSDEDSEGRGRRRSRSRSHSPSEGRSSTEASGSWSGEDPDEDGPLGRRTATSVSILRSVGTWCGSPQTDSSIYHTTLELIEKAERFVYVENQFLITSPGPGIRNHIGEALVQRIDRAITAGDASFRVFIVVNVLPDGDVVTSRAVRQVAHNNLESLRAVVRALRRKHPRATIDNHLSISTLRTHGYLPSSHDGGPRRVAVTERVYCHSKVIVVDDTRAIVGSANINDRSLLGDRDTEAAVLVRDDLGRGTLRRLDGVPRQVGRSVFPLRRDLMAKHLGLATGDDCLADPCTDAFFHGRWNGTAKTNQELYEDCFPCVPSDAIHTLEDYLTAATVAVRPERLQGVRGFLCRFPTRFLCEEANMTPKFGDAEYFLSAESFQ